MTKCPPTPPPHPLQLLCPGLMNLQSDVSTTEDVVFPVFCFWDFWDALSSIKRGLQTVRVPVCVCVFVLFTCWLWYGSIIHSTLAHVPKTHFGNSGLIFRHIIPTAALVIVAPLVIKAQADQWSNSSMLKMYELLLWPCGYILLFLTPLYPTPSCCVWHNGVRWSSEVSSIVFMLKS